MKRIVQALVASGLLVTATLVVSLSPLRAGLTSRPQPRMAHKELAAKRSVDYYAQCAKCTWHGVPSARQADAATDATKHQRNSPGHLVTVVEDNFTNRFQYIAECGSCHMWWLTAVSRQSDAADIVSKHQRCNPGHEATVLERDTQKDVTDNWTIQCDKCKWSQVQSTRQSDAADLATKHQHCHPGHRVSVVAVKLTG